MTASLVIAPRRDRNGEAAGRAFSYWTTFIFNSEAEDRAPRGHEPGSEDWIFTRSHCSLWPLVPSLQILLSGILDLDAESNCDGDGGRIDPIGAAESKEKKFSCGQPHGHVRPIAQ